ncbi:TPA: hypothetical protein ACH3X2_007812 [Trebouxia sp. C0005]|nr:MAG: hypothetical protein FRX49_12298 [Trebouxia sp. A1-2]
MGDAVSHEELVAIVRTNYQKTQEEFCDLRQSIAADAEELDEKITELKSLLLQSTGFKLPGPTDAAGVASTLETADKQDAAVKEFGAEWLVSVQSLIPVTVWAQEDFPGKFCKVKQSLATASGMPQPSSLPSPPGLPIAVTPTLTNGYPSIGNAASGPNPSMPSLAPTPAVSGMSLPFSATLAGKHVKIELPRPRRFTKIDVNSDIHAWLSCIQEYLTISAIDVSYWVVFATNYFEKAPLQLWEARKIQLHTQPDVLYSWHSFRQWCIDSFSLHNVERHALAQLEDLRQTGSVAEYKAAHNVLAAKTNLPMQLRIYWWERGLKPEIAAEIKVDPLTYKGYTDIEKAQQAACAYGAHYDPSPSAASRKRDRPVSSSDTDSGSDTSDTERN